MDYPTLFLIGREDLRQVEKIARMLSKGNSITPYQALHLGAELMRIYLKTKDHDYRD